MDPQHSPQIGGARGVEQLSVRLARLAVEVDRVALALADECLTRSDLLLISATHRHLSIGVAVIEDLLYALDFHGETGPRVAVESDRLAA